jgi:predicted flavoprotein YhiN
LQPSQKSAELAKNSWRNLAGHFKAHVLHVTGTRGFEKAEVTAGGVALPEVNPRTLESKIVPGLFIVGEVLDIDGPIGGYNFQAAFSTGFLAARSM